jgi:hypothetical protein
MPSDSEPQLTPSTMGRAEKRAGRGLVWGANADLAAFG